MSPMIEALKVMNEAFARLNAIGERKSMIFEMVQKTTMKAYTATSCAKRKKAISRVRKTAFAAIDRAYFAALDQAGF